MFDFFDTVAGFFITFGQYLFNILKMLGNLLTMVLSVTTIPNTLMLLVPGIIGSCIATVTVIAVAKFIVGR